MKRDVEVVMKYQDIDEYFMEEALKEAEKSLLTDDVPVGAIIVKDGKIITRAHNEKNKAQNPLKHAEVTAINKAAKKLNTWILDDCTIYVTLEPCPMCAGAILMARVGLCVYGASDPLRGCCGSVYDLPMDPELQGSTQWISSICEQDCQTLLKRFFSERRATNSPGI